MTADFVVHSTSHKQVVPAGNVTDEGEMIGHFMVGVPCSQTAHFQLQHCLQEPVV